MTLRCVLRSKCHCRRGVCSWELRSTPIHMNINDADIVVDLLAFLLFACGIIDAWVE